jgi:hypothetical protein
MSAQPHPYPTCGQPLFGGGIHTAADVERMPDDGYRDEMYRGALIRMLPHNVEQAPHPRTGAPT